MQFRFYASPIVYNRPNQWRRDRGGVLVKGTPLLWENLPQLSPKIGENLAEFSSILGKTRLKLSPVLGEIRLKSSLIS
jgi:hypothetical protein